MDKVICLVAVATLLMGCQAPIGTSKSSDLPNSPKVLAEKYTSSVKNLFESSMKEKKRSADGSVTVSARTVAILSTFAPTAMVDENGEQITFDQLREEQARVLLDAWAKEKQASLTAQLEEDLQYGVQVDANTEAVVAINSQDFETSEELSQMVNRHLAKSTNAMEALYSRAMSVPQVIGSARSSTGRGFAFSTNAATNIINNYRQGRIITGAGTLDFGHDAIFSEPEANILWLQNPDQEISWSSWSGRGVFKEHLSDWTNLNNWIKTVRINNVRYRYWQWTGPWWWPTGEYRYNYPDAAAGARAVANAASFDGRPYQDPWPWPASNKDDTSKFYCSQLVWRAWYNVATEWDLNIGSGSIGGVIAPGNICFNTERTIEVAYFRID